jgi:hypothetical protein
VFEMGLASVPCQENVLNLYLSGTANTQAVLKLHSLGSAVGCPHAYALSLCNQLLE